ncbi:MAG: ABC transporter ATP-binding protein [Patescibacteria group bacterium]|nr:ABC transporter ATP-binding protein [Patescibacteria group bacterium]
MIRIKNLTRIYSLGDVRVKAIQDVTLNVEQGEVVTIMGKSGSGKSTLLRQLGLLDRPTSGEVYIEGEEVSSMGDRKRSHLRLEKLGYVFQEFALLPELSAYENVYLPGLMLSKKGVDFRKKAREILSLVGLGERIDHKPRELSGGEQQRVAIARSLINSPKYIFADEPCANLDTLSSKAVMNTLVDLNKRLGITVIFVSHDPDDKMYSNRQIFLKDGRLVEPYF